MKQNEEYTSFLQNRCPDDRENHLSVQHVSVDGQFELCHVVHPFPFFLRPKRKDNKHQVAHPPRVSPWMDCDELIPELFQFCQERRGFGLRRLCRRKPDLARDHEKTL